MIRASMLIFVFSLTLTAWAQTFGIEVKANYRDSDQTQFALPFSFPPIFLPVGETTGFLETVDAGDHFEISRISLFLEGEFGDGFSGRIKVDGVDRYDRNPTSGDNEIDVDEAWLGYGVDTPHDLLPEGSGWYLRLGKFGKFERQDDRNLESYGLMSTTYNRFEDAGLEIGVDIGRHFYIKASYSQGNPVFFRDPNALAGDNGTDELNPFENPNPDPELKSGIVMFYDAEVEDLDFEEPETGLAIGARFGDDAGSWTLNLMAYGYRRDLAEEVDLTGTFYNGDLDLLRGVEEFGAVDGLPISGDDKEEFGVNLWLYAGAFTLFGQYVDSEVASLPSDGFEVETAYVFDLPISMAIADKPLFSFIQPAVRYSEWNPDFTGVGTVYPTPSVWWEWRKLDYGLNIGIYEDLMLTVEQADTEFFAGGRWRDHGELLATLTWRWFND